MSYKVDLKSLRSSIEPLMRKAGDLQLSLFRSDKLQVRRKVDQSYVCNADVESEKMLIKGLTDIFDEAGFFAEESGQSENDAAYHWVIDPLDGTTNYVHGLPYFGISVALTYKYEPIWGGVFNPIANDFFYAYKNGGAYLGDQRLHMPQEGSMRNTMIIIGLPYTQNEGFAKVLKHVPEIARRSYAFRHFGSAALDQAYLARGGLDGMFFPRLGWWDIAAGMLLITEADGKVTDFDGKPIDYDYGSYLAGSQAVHAELLELLKDGPS